MNTKITPFFKYLSYVIRHKYFVARECFRHGLWWRGLTHDMSKLRPSEFFPYANYFYGNLDKFMKNGRMHQPGDDAKFDYAWLLHQKRNKHHWQFWLLQNDEDGLRILPMPMKYVVEMVCDWKGAGKAQGHGHPGELQEWYNKNKEKMQLHPNTRAEVENLIEWI